MARKTGLTGREKAAILLISLGPDKSAKIFKHLQDDEIEELTLEIANMRKVGAEEKQDIIEEFYQICLAQNYISEGGINYAKEVLEKAMGSNKALEIINKLTASLQVRPFDFVRKADASQLLNFIQNEHPQTIALILSYLGSNQAGQILSALPQEKQADVAQRIATMDITSPEIIKEVEHVLERKLSSMVTQDYTSTGGVGTIVDILNSVDRGTEKFIMETLEIQDTELAEEIKKRMFVFEDIITLDSASIQRFIREVDNNELSIALKGATQEVKDIIFANMSKRMAEMIREDMEFMGPVRLRDVEEAQQKIVNIIRKLEEAGEIILSRGGGDEIIV
ncbi:MAG: flagellar motor switch protein FliG [Clostridia bacterium]|nr:flagellar motor switch protein FliG [Clostridia bacterium]